MTSDTIEKTRELRRSRNTSSAPEIRDYEVSWGIRSEEYDSGIWSVEEGRYLEADDCGLQQTEFETGNIRANTFSFYFSFYVNAFSEYVSGVERDGFLGNFQHDKNSVQN